MGKRKLSGWKQILNTEDPTRKKTKAGNSRENGDDNVTENVTGNDTKMIESTNENEKGKMESIHEYDTAMTDTSIENDEKKIDTANENDTEMVVNSTDKNTEMIENHYDDPAPIMLHDLDDLALISIFRYLSLQDRKNCREVCSNLNRKIMMLDSNLCWRLDITNYIQYSQSDKDVIINSNMKINLMLPQEMPSKQTQLKRELRSLIDSAGHRIVALHASADILDRLYKMLNITTVQKMSIFFDLELEAYKCKHLSSVLEQNSPNLRFVTLENIDLTQDFCLKKDVKMPKMTSIKISHCHGNAQLATLIHRGRHNVGKIEINHITDIGLFNDLDFEMPKLKKLRIMSINRLDLTSLLQNCTNLKEFVLCAESVSTQLADNQLNSLTHIRITLIHEETSLPMNLINSAAKPLHDLKLGNIKTCPNPHLIAKLQDLKALHLVCCSDQVMASLIKVSTNIEELCFDCSAYKLPRQDWGLLTKLRRLKLRCNYAYSLRKSLPKHVKILKS